MIHHIGVSMSISVSVILPIYNAERTVKEAIESVLATKDVDYELICIDDGSLDSSAEICKEYANKYEQIKYYRQENQGVGGARNTGIKYATGEYFSFIDADDTIYPDTYSILYNAVKEKKIDVCFAGHLRCFRGEEEARSSVKEHIEIYDKADINTYINDFITKGFMDKHDNINLGFYEGSVNCCLLNRQFIIDNSIRFFHFWNDEDDWIFTILMMKHAKAICMIPDVIYRYNVAFRSGSLSQRRYYIKDLYNNRMKGIEFIINILKQTNSNHMNQVLDYEIYLVRYLLLLSLYNETVKVCPNKARQSISEIKNVTVKLKTIYKDRIYYKNDCLEKSKLQKIYILLLLHHGATFCYILNRFLLHRYR